MLARRSQQHYAHHSKRIKTQARYFRIQSSFGEPR
ncbi:uncharacterized protein G2W53_026704 [Senna tora]|uniref:Uncharacterized protein n=1 Tax=Senna tora TaxID=362788 RepID=A0A834TPJ9_9FABA|nr:uncharacterized protein G2W53_026704 [Senna tora]